MVTFRAPNLLGNLNIHRYLNCIDISKHIILIFTCEPYFGPKDVVFFSPKYLRKLLERKEQKSLHFLLQEQSNHSKDAVFILLYLFIYLFIYARKSVVKREKEQNSQCCI